jgi:Holliday junction resolvase RusA-like endonuclease
MTSLTFFAQGIPKGQPRPRAFARKFGAKWSARVYDAATAEGWKSQVADAFAKQKPPGFQTFDGPVEVEMRFHFPRPKCHLRSNGNVKQSAPHFHTCKPDCDNAAKAVLDALTQIGVWRDDKQVCRLLVEKTYSGNAGASITIQQLEAQNA